MQKVKFAGKGGYLTYTVTLGGSDEYEKQFWIFALTIFQ